MVLLTTQHLERMRIPQKHWGAKLSLIPDRCEHKKIVSNYVANIEDHLYEDSRGLLLFGNYSVGKSALAAIILKAAMAAGEVGLWISSRDIPTYVIQNTPFDDNVTVYDRAHKVRALVIDELIIRDDIKYTEQSIETLIRRRVDECLMTILTTNHAPAAIKEKYPALAEVLLEATTPVRVSGHNFREVIASESDARIRKAK